MNSYSITASNSHLHSICPVIVLSDETLSASLSLEVLAALLSPCRHPLLDAVCSPNRSPTYVI